MIITVVMLGKFVFFLMGTSRTFLGGKDQISSGEGKRKG